MSGTDFFPLQFEWCTRLGEFKWWNTTCIARSCWQCKSKVNIDLKKNKRKDVGSTEIDRKYAMKSIGTIGKTFLPTNSGVLHTHAPIHSYIHMVHMLISCSHCVERKNFIRYNCVPCFGKWCIGKLVLALRQPIHQFFGSLFTSIHVFTQKSTSSLRSHSRIANNRRWSSHFAIVERWKAVIFQSTYKRKAKANEARKERKTSEREWRL